MLAALTALCCLPVAAEWRSLGDAGNAEVFVDPTTIVRKGDTATMWSIYALKSPASAGNATYVSLKREDEFDCKEPRMRGLQIAAHPEPMAAGQAVMTEKRATPWNAVTPQSIGEKLWKLACGKE